MFVTKKALPRRTFLLGRRHDDGAAAAGIDGSRVHGARADAGQTSAALWRGLLPERRHEQALVPRRDRARATSTRRSSSRSSRFAISVTSFGNLSRAGGKSVTDHAVSSAGWLSGAVAKQTEAEDIRVGISIDQVIAKQIGQDTQLPSMEVATEDFSGYVGGCVPGYSCAYMNSISWASETQSNPMEINPRTAFERMFGRSSTTAERLERIQEDRSILDSVTRGSARPAAEGRAPGIARASATTSTTSARSSGASSATEAQNSKSVIALDAPLGVPDTFEDHAALMFDLLAVAYQSDLTRVFSFMMSREASQRTYPELNIPQHAPRRLAPRRPPENMENHAKINLHYAQLFADFVEKLKAMPEGDGTVLDNSLIFYGAGHERRPGARAVSAAARRRRRRAAARSKAIATSSRRNGRRSPTCGSASPICIGIPLETFAESTGRVEI